MQKKGEGRHMIQTTLELDFPTKQATCKNIKKHARAQFTLDWTPTTVAKIGDCIRHDFQTNLQTDMWKYMGVNMGYTTWAQHQARL
jgi:hypothetical protein